MQKIMPLKRTGTDGEAGKRYAVLYMEPGIFRCITDHFFHNTIIPDKQEKLDYIDEL